MFDWPCSLYLYDLVLQWQSYRVSREYSRMQIKQIFVVEFLYFSVMWDFTDHSRSDLNMGLCIGSLGSSIACCFGNAFCSLCCAACPSCKGSTSTRIAYGLILLAGLITSCIMLIPGLEKTLAKIPALCSGSKLTNPLVPSIPSIDCSKIVGFLAVYRLSFGMAVFFFLFFLLVSRDSKNRWWLKKRILCRWSTSNRRRIFERKFKMDSGDWNWWPWRVWSSEHSSFRTMASPKRWWWSDWSADSWWVTVLLGDRGWSSLFELVHSRSIAAVHWLRPFVSIPNALSFFERKRKFPLTRWNEAWIDRVESGSKKHGYGLLFFTLFFYAVSITGVVLFYVYYASDRSNCGLHIFFITFNLCLCLILSIISILPNVREHNASCGLLQSSFVTLYVMYYTWSVNGCSRWSACWFSLIPGQRWVTIPMLIAIRAFVGWSIRVTLAWRRHRIQIRLANRTCSIRSPWLVWWCLLSLCSTQSLPHRATIVPTNCSSVQAHRIIRRC